jgi:hypothetical protein
MRPEHELSLADLILIAAKRSANPHERRRLQPVAQALLSPSTQKLSYAPSLTKLVDRSRSIEAEEIIGQIKPDYLPFDQVWLEGPPYKFGDKYLSPHLARYGHLITADHAKKHFSFRLLCFENEASGLRDDYDRMKVTFPYHIHNDKAISVQGEISTIVCSERGIVLDADRVLQAMEQYEKSRVKAGSVGFVDDNYDPGTIDVAYYAADYLARALVLMGSPVVQAEVNWQRSATDRAADRQVRERLRINATPRMTLDPIGIDLARINPKVSSESSDKVMRELLGITSVRRSREIISRNGVRFTRRPHDRRIEAPVDRRQVTRHISASQMFDVEIGPSGPLRKLGEPT